MIQLAIMFLILILAFQVLRHFWQMKISSYRFTVKRVVHVVPTF